MKHFDNEVDERVIAVNHRAGYYAYLVMGWMLVADMMLRGLRPNWTSWDGFPVDVLVVIAGGAGTQLFYTLSQRTVGKRRSMALLLSVAVAAVFAAALVFLLRRFH
jgi:hypothetical protein